MPVDMAKFKTSMSLFCDRARNTSLFTGTFSKLSFFNFQHLLNNRVRLEVEMFAMVKSKYISRAVKSAYEALEPGEMIGEQI